MILTLISLCFIIAYILIALEHPLKLDKAVPAIFFGVLSWAIIGIFKVPLAHDMELNEGLSLMLSDIAEILLFLIGAMTIVEIIDLHGGFQIISNLIKEKSSYRLLIIICLFSFFLSPVLDNLTTTIVMISFVRKLIQEPEKRWWYASFVVIATNAGGAWSPIGDVTTTMLWIGQKITTGALIKYLFLPSLVCIIVPIVIAKFLKPFRGTVQNSEEPAVNIQILPSSKTMLVVGVLSLIFVPVFKQLTHLPPYLGMMFSLAIVWLVSDIIKPTAFPFTEIGKKLTIKNALGRIEMPSILFFFGILAAVGALEAVGILASLAKSLDIYFNNHTMIVFLLGLLSAIIDNVPLVAGSLGMYSFELDHPFWHELAFAAGTGGSILIIGSAAGVAAMGMEKINFIWYLKNIAWLALLGYLAGWAVMYLTL
ncbi:MAG: sodium:proton antiporter NhaD [Bacteroidota bacterium]|nr:sodium:proton antiporter NhaD [Bacteroidota bacterium]